GTGRHPHPHPGRGGRARPVPRPRRPGRGPDSRPASAVEVPAAPRAGLAGRERLDADPRALAAGPALRPARAGRHPWALPGRARVRDAQLAAIEADLAPWYDAPPFADAVHRLSAYRGVTRLGALTLGSEVCDWRRFPRAAAVTAL